MFLCFNFGKTFFFLLPCTPPFILWLNQEAIGILVLFFFSFFNFLSFSRTTFRVLTIQPDGNITAYSIMTKVCWEFELKCLMLVFLYGWLGFVFFFFNQSGSLTLCKQLKENMYTFIIDSQKPRNMCFLNWIYPFPYASLNLFLLMLVKYRWGGANYNHVHFWFLNSISFLFNFLLKYNVRTEIGTDLECTVQWVFTNWICVGNHLGLQIKNNSITTT